MAPQPVALILGSGPRVGASVAAAFRSKGYSVATASRSGTGAKTPEGYLSLAADFTDPSSIPALFGSVKNTFGAAPSVVIYNAAGLTPPPDNDSVLSIPAERFVNDLNVNTVSPYVAAQKAVEGWATLAGDVKKTFIYTGNPLNVQVAPMPLFLNLGVGKRASTYWIAVADDTYAAKGYRCVYSGNAAGVPADGGRNRFHYADERAEGGKGKGNNLDGPAHGEFYLQLASHEGNIPWHATFVASEGYGKFD
jgi:NAD(P)-dependent dehydrogenase (short-subunit alcohol dehydrogenase family)